MSPPIDPTMARWPPLGHTQPMIELHFAGYQPARSVHTRALHALRDRVARQARRCAPHQGDRQHRRHRPQGQRSAHHGGHAANSTAATSRRAISRAACRRSACSTSRSRLARARHVFGELDGDNRSGSRRTGGSGNKLSRSRLVGQRHPSHQQRRPADPNARRLCRPAPPHARQRAASIGIPSARICPDVHRCCRSAARGGRPHGRRTGEPAHQYDQLRPCTFTTSTSA